MKSTYKITLNVRDSSLVVKDFVNKLLQAFGIFLLLGAVLFSFTNRVIIYPLLAFAAFSLFSSFTLVSTQKISIPKVWISLVILSVYFLVSAILSGLSIKNLLSYGFIRYDGNFFVSFFPLFFLPFLLNSKVQKEYMFHRWIQAILWGIAILTDILTLSFLAHHPIGAVDAYGIYFYLFKAHNAAGSFYLVMFFIVLLFLLNPKFKNSRLANMFASISFLVALWITKSRGSILGALWAFWILFVDHVYPFKYLKHFFIASSVFILIIINIILLLYGYKGWIDLGKPNYGFFEEKALPTFLNALSTDKYERFENIADRLFYLWPRALNDFALSPIVGIGFTRFNDVPMYLEGIKYYVMLNTTKTNIEFNSSHAHHTFLHVMAETGLVGLFLLIVFIVDLFNFVKRIESPLSSGLYYALWAMLGASFTEHRFFTPSGMLVISILIIVALFTSNRSYKELHKNN